MVLSLEERHAKLRQLAEIEGYSSKENLLRNHVTDSVCPAICTNEGCDYTAPMEPDQDAGHCEVCHTQTVQSALVLAGLI